MTGKLIKYEIKSSVKLIAVIWEALITVSILLSVLSNVLFARISTESMIGSIIDAIIGFIFVGLFIAMIVVTIMIVILRFYRGLLGDEGYLMHTLPVKPWQLITSKGIVSAGVVIVSILAGILSILIVGGFSSMIDVADFFRELPGFIRREPMAALAGLEMLILLILSLMKSIYQIYASLAIGQLAGKHRILLSLGAYIGINIVVTVLAVILMYICDGTGVLESVNSFILSSDVYKTVHAAMAVIFAFTAIQLAAFHIIAERIMTKKLNLQ